MLPGGTEQPPHHELQLPLVAQIRNQRERSSDGVLVSTKLPAKCPWPLADTWSGGTTGISPIEWHEPDITAMPSLLLLWTLNPKTENRNRENFYLKPLFYSLMAAWRLVLSFSLFACLSGWTQTSPCCHLVAKSHYYNSHGVTFCCCWSNWAINIQILTNQTHLFYSVNQSQHPTMFYIICGHEKVNSGFASFTWRRYLFLH